MVGERLRKLRKEKKLNQEELADIIGVQKSTVSLYEINKIDPSDKVKIEIAKYFNISLDYLLGIIDEPVPYYNRDMFLLLPKDISGEDRKLHSEIIDFLEYKKSKV